MTSFFFSALTPWLLFIFVFQKITIRNSAACRYKVAALFTGMLLAAGILIIPIGGLSVARWLASFSNSFSIPLMGILGIAIVKQTFSRTIFSPCDWKAVWLFGAIASFILYPSALGLSRVDTYVWGWGCGPVFIGTALLTMALLFMGNRFGVLLLLALAAFIVPLQESTNLWDYLIDPFYAVISIFMASKQFCKKRS